MPPPEPGSPGWVPLSSRAHQVAAVTKLQGHRDWALHPLASPTPVEVPSAGRVSPSSLPSSPPSSRGHRDRPVVDEGTLRAARLQFLREQMEAERRRAVEVARRAAIESKATRQACEEEAKRRFAETVLVLGARRREARAFQDALVQDKAQKEAAARAAEEQERQRALQKRAEEFERQKHAVMEHQAHNYGRVGGGGGSNTSLKHSISALAVSTSGGGAPLILPTKLPNTRPRSVVRL